MLLAKSLDISPVIMCDACQDSELNGVYSIAEEAMLHQFNALNNFLR